MRLAASLLKQAMPEYRLISHKSTVANISSPLLSSSSLIVEQFNLVLDELIQRLVGNIAEVQSDTVFLGDSQNLGDSGVVSLLSGLLDSVRHKKNHLSSFIVFILYDILETKSRNFLLKFLVEY